VAWWVKEIKGGHIQEMGEPGRAAVAKHTTTLSAMVATFKDRKFDATVKIVAGSGKRVGLPQVLGEEYSKVFVGTRGRWWGT